MLKRSRRGLPGMPKSPEQIQNMTEAQRDRAAAVRRGLELLETLRRTGVVIADEAGDR